MTGDAAPLNARSPGGGRAPTGPLAVVFDFDGTLVDTEWSIFERARAAIAALGGELTAEQWATHSVGRSSHEPWWDDLRVEIGLDVTLAELDAAREAVTDVPPTRDSAPMTDGAAELIAALVAAGIPLAVASGSHREWIEHHLGRFGLVDDLPVLVGIDHPRVTAGKPAPDLYRVAVEELGSDPARTVAVEDTTRGVESARAARVGAVVAVPSRLTATHDLSAADVVVPSLGHLDLPTLAALVDDRG